MDDRPLETKPLKSDLKGLGIYITVFMALVNVYNVEKVLKANK